MFRQTFPVPKLLLFGLFNNSIFFPLTLGERIIYTIYVYTYVIILFLAIN